MIAIAVCTYNPDERIFTRVLNAIAAQDIPRDGIECVIVDNCSTPALRTRPLVQDFLRRCDWARVIEEPRPGLTYARIAAIDNTSAPIVCFVDDDNEPASNYLVEAEKVLSDYPCIGVVGAGKVVVDYVDPVSEDLARRISYLFQEKDFKGLVYGCVGGTWTDYYPPGSCMVVRREVLLKSKTAFLDGVISATDRMGAKLTSGGDVQIVWESIKMGFAAGLSSCLKLNHLIPAKRTSLNYIKRLCFGTSSSYLPALVDSFPEQRKALPPVPTVAAIIRDIVRMTGGHLLRNRVGLLPISIATYLGTMDGLFRASGKRSRFLDGCVRAFKLE